MILKLKISMPAVMNLVLVINMRTLRLPESYSVPPNMTVTSENKVSNEQPSENNPKFKPKRTAKFTSKVKKDDITDKSYILDLENQINVLKSTLNLYEKSKGINQKQPEHSPLT